MTIRTNFMQGAVGAAVLVALAAGPAAAQLDDGAVDCRATIAKSYSKLVSTASKTIGGCHKSRNAGKIGADVDCNDVVEADSKGKIDGAQQKLKDAINDKCAGQDELIDAEYYASCPFPCADAAPNPIADMGDLGECLACLGPALVAQTTTDTLDSPAPPTMTKDDQKCHSTIAKSYGKYVDTLLKGRNACQGDNDGVDVNDIDDCADADPAGKGAAALTKAEEGVVKACTAADLTRVASCSTGDIGALQNCLEAQYNALATSVFTSTYELPTTLCPTGIRSTVRAGKSVDGDTDSTLSVGWTGLGHQIDITDKYTITSDLTCDPEAFAGACGECQVAGIRTSDTQASYYSRCVANPQTPCSNTFGNDAACPSSGPCGYYLGTPLPVSAGGTPTCTLNRMFSNVTGTANPDTGESDLNLDLRAVVNLGFSQIQPCSVCEGDITAQDGVKDGTCSGGHISVNGDPCDVQAFDKSYSLNGFDQVSGLSLDCPPHSTENISGGGLIIDLPLTTGSTSLAFEDNCDGAASGEMCACGVCTGDGATPCRKDTDCSGMGLGSCGQGSGPDRNPNQCTDYVCDEGVSTSRGTCGVDTPLETYCDGLTRANGRGVVSCAIDADCNSIDCNGSAPGTGCGTCSIFQVKSCFLDPIEIQGEPSATNPVLAGLFCLPPTSNTGVNSAAGSPGPGEVKVDMLVEKLYD